MPIARQADRIARPPSCRDRSAQPELIAVRDRWRRKRARECRRAEQCCYEWRISRCAALLPTASKTLPSPRHPHHVSPRPSEAMCRSETKKLVRLAQSRRPPSCGQTTPEFACGARHQQCVVRDRRQSVIAALSPAGSFLRSAVRCERMTALAQAPTMASRSASRGFLRHGRHSPDAGP